MTTRLYAVDTFGILFPYFLFKFSVIKSFCVASVKTEKHLKLSRLTWRVSGMFKSLRICYLRIFLQGHPSTKSNSSMGFLGGMKTANFAHISFMFLYILPCLLISRLTDRECHLDKFVRRKCGFGCLLTGHFKGPANANLRSSRQRDLVFNRQTFKQKPRFVSP